MPDDPDPFKLTGELYRDLIRRRPAIKKAADYYDGCHNLAFAGEKFLDAFGGQFRAFADNWCAVVTDAVEERLQIAGFRVNNEPKADDGAHKIWQTNDMDMQAQLGHTDGLHQGAFYVTCWPSGDETPPELTVDSCMGTIVRRHPKFRNRVTAALRTWSDDDGYEHAELFGVGDRVYMLRSKAKQRGDSASERITWVIEDLIDEARDLDASGSKVNPFGKLVPVVEFLNRPRLWRSQRAGFAAHSEITSVIPLQNAVNKLFADMLVASEFGAFPQRYLTGYTPAEDPVTKATVDPEFRSGPGKTWWVEDSEAKFGAFQTADLGQFVTTIEMVVQHIASISSTPPHYLRASADRLSGESLKSAETGLVKKVRRKAQHYGASWEQVMRLAGIAAQNSALAQATAMETIWTDPETRTESEHVDALQKKKALNVPDPQLWEEAGYSPQQIARFPALAAQTQIATLAAGVAAGIGTTGVAQRTPAANVKAQADAVAVLVNAGWSQADAAAAVGMNPGTTA